MIEDNLRVVISLLETFKVVSCKISLCKTTGQTDKSYQSILSNEITSIYAQIRGILDQISYETKILGIESLDDHFESCIGHFFACYNGMSSYKAYDVMTYLLQRVGFIKDWITKLEKKKIHLLSAGREN